MRHPAAWLALLWLAAAPAAAEEDAGPGPESPAEVSAPPPGEDPAAMPFGFRAFDSDDPLAIEAEELEATQQGGRRQLVFRKNVRVVQGELRIRCAQLEAFYPRDANQPDRLVARGAVKLAQGRQTAHCDEAVYDRPEDRLVCRGNALFQDGDNRLAGDEIEIDLRDESVVVRGKASVLIQPEKLRAGEPEEPS